MKNVTLTRTECRTLGVLALFGGLVPNGIFIYFFLTDAATVRDAFANPVSTVFIFEAFFLMFFFAWLLKRAHVGRPGGLAFVAMSIVGSMAFSVPATLYLVFRERNSTRR